MEGDRRRWAPGDRPVASGHEMIVRRGPEHVGLGERLEHLGVLPPGNDLAHGGFLAEGNQGAVFFYYQHHVLERGFDLDDLHQVVVLRDVRLHEDQARAVARDRPATG